MYHSNNTRGYRLLHVLPHKNSWRKYQWINFRGKLCSSKVGHKATKAHRVCPNRKQQAVSEKAYTEEQVSKLSVEEVDKLFSNDEAKLSGQMVKSLGKSIIRMISMGACAALGISNQNALSEDLESDPFLNLALQRFTC